MQQEDRSGDQNQNTTGTQNNVELSIEERDPLLDDENELKVQA